MKTKFKITGISQMSMEHSKGEKKTKLLTCDLILEIDKQLDYYAYHTKENILNADGCKAITLAFTSGLAGSIIHADKMGYWNKEEHLQYIIDQIKRQIAAKPEIEKG